MFDDGSDPVLLKAGGSPSTSPVEIFKSVETSDHGSSFVCESVQRMPGEEVMISKRRRRRRRQAEDGVENISGDDDVGVANFGKVDAVEGGEDDLGDDSTTTAEPWPLAGTQDEGEQSGVVEGGQASKTVEAGGSAGVEEEEVSQDDDDGEEEEEEEEEPPPRFHPGEVVFRTMSERSAALRVVFVPSVAVDRDDNSSSLAFVGGPNSTALEIPFTFASRPAPGDEDVVWTATNRSDFVLASLHSGQSTDDFAVFHVVPDVDDDSLFTSVFTIRNVTEDVTVTVVVRNFLGDLAEEYLVTYDPGQVRKWGAREINLHAQFAASSIDIPTRHTPCSRRYTYLTYFKRNCLIGSFRLVCDQLDIFIFGNF